MLHFIGGGGGQAYESAFNHSWLYHQLQVGFSGICRCMHGDIMRTGLVWAERSASDNFWVPSHQFNSATSEQKGIPQTIYTDSEPPSRLPNSLMPSAKLRSANLFGVTRSGIEPRPPAPRADALTTTLRRGGLVNNGEKDQFEILHCHRN